MRTGSARENLWRNISYLFLEGEGSLPEIRLVGLSPEGTAAAFDELLRRADPLTASQTIWHDELDREVPLNAVPNVGNLVATGRISSFHVVLRGIRSEQARLPDLGVSVSRDEVALDYQPGAEWDRDTLAAFVELLFDLQSLAGGGDLYAASELDLVSEEEQERFRAAIAEYRDAS